MNVRQKIALHLLFYTVLCSPVFAQVVEIPDPNLRASIVDALGIPRGSPITQEDMNRLTDLDVQDQGIANLTGLEFATNLERLHIAQNPIVDLNPLADLRKLEHLIMWGLVGVDISPLATVSSLRTLDASGCDISDISVLSNLTMLNRLDLQVNFITDLSPLAGLANLVQLRLTNNQIRDVSPLSGLTALDLLHININDILDHSPLDGLALSELLQDYVCEFPPLPLEPRLTQRNYPSIFTRWGTPISNRPVLDTTNKIAVANIAQHDLDFGGLPSGLRFVEHSNGFKVVGNVERHVQRRDTVLAHNPNFIQLVDLGVRAAALDAFPEDSPYWIRDANGDIFSDVYKGVRQPHGFIDFTKPIVQDMIVQKAVAVAQCGLFDGIFFDFWADQWTVLGGWDGTRSYFPYTLKEEQQARLALVRRLRAATRPDFLIMGNTNYATLPNTGPYMNGAFMETAVPGANTTAERKFRLGEIEKALHWFEQNLREPKINGLEGFGIPGEPPDSPDNLRWMRAFTTLSLTHSDGYILFSKLTPFGNPASLPDDWDEFNPYEYTGGGRGHYWYDFWDADLGRPVGEKAQLYENREGLYIREFTNGWAVYNHSGSAQVITLPEEAQGVASNLAGTEHEVANLDGEMYLKAVASDQPPVTSENPADVNGDGVVNILDLVVVAQAISTGVGEGDVNGDGVVNVFDLVFVAGAIGGGGAVPSAYSPELSIISAADVEKWLTDAQGLGVGDANFQRGIRFLEGLLAALTPKETTLLPNYPNPFNPETWIPYRLAREAEVAIAIYDTKGTMVRRLALGNQAAGYYAERGRAAYWDGRNEDGEAVASGIYIYRFRAGDYAASRRMVIVK